MTGSNLPPGCNSADGGIDHELEAAHEKLCDEVDHPLLAEDLISMIPAIQAIQSRSWAEGKRAGIEERMLLDDVYSSTLERCLTNIVGAYAAYQRFGGMPAPEAYSCLTRMVAMIEEGRKLLEGTANGSQPT